MRGDLEGLRFAIVGASGVLGSSVARELAQRGAALILAGRSPEKLARVAGAHPGAHLVPGDLRRPEVRRLLFAAASQESRLDGVLVSVGEADYHALAALDDARIHEILDVNLGVPVLVVRTLLPALLRQKRGSVVLVASVWGVEPASGEVAYAAAKAGLVGFGRSLAKECEPSSIRVNVLAPGAFESPMLEGLGSSGRRALAARAGGELMPVQDVSLEAVRLLHPDATETGCVIRIEKASSA